MPSPKGRKLSNSPSTPGGPNQNGPSNNQAAFINKLYSYAQLFLITTGIWVGHADAVFYSMLEDQNVQQLIYWDPSGTYFIVNNITEFSKSVLPQYFKHNNFASFVRQLNMYGFHKINDMFHSNSSDVWEFKHPDFRRGEVELLQSIKRKATKTSTLSKSMADMTSDEKIIHLTNRVEELEQKLAKIHESYAMVWSETCSARALQSKHHQVISSLTAYLATTYDDRDPEKAAKRRKIDVDNLMNEGKI
ncbi:hypothetical protein HK097_006834 [Rhizophlyctis rosea]|uniref:HSF-type DNA-binding domain-containing protein n=1 Tax=Rhizophlyctis rosea TaxID=64517 RepID=A0AAD5SEK4_9FUNG|nr:hypothetical protein HK097_006834 [Rhizophlyctis rosea]